jgi:NADH-quinone oxidoreductase subunit N
VGSGEFSSVMFLAILPEIGLVLLAAILLILDLAWRDKSEVRNRSLGWITAAGLLVLMIAAILFSNPGSEAQSLWGNMLRFDQAGFVFRMIFLAGAALTALFASQYEWLSQRGEFFVMLLISTLGMSLMASAADLILLFLAIETTSIPLYVLAGFILRSDKSVEAGIKYLLFGAMTSAVMLYGFSLLYGFTGTTHLYELTALLKTGQVPFALLAAVMGLVLVGFAFKVSAVPFHFWAPDVYQGAPTPVAGFLSTASKAAGFVVLLRFLQVVFPEQVASWSLVIAVLATVSMLVGNYLALAQKSVKRLLAYSSIAQAGYILIGVAAGSELGAQGAIYYLMAYLVTNLAAFGIVSLVEKSTGSDDLSAFNGLSRRSPGMALAMLVAMLSLGGIPPFAGFFAKLLVFASAIEAGMVWLAMVGLFNAIIGLYYYLVVLKAIYLYSPETDQPLARPADAWRLALVVCVAGVLLLGFWFAPWFNFAQLATSAIWI